MLQLMTVEYLLTRNWGVETNARQELLGMLGFDPSEIAAKAAEYTEDDVSNGVDSMSLNGKNSSGMSVATHDVIRKALLVGDFEAAVECCFRTGNLADALVLASCGGADLWTKTQARYFQSESPKRPFLSIVSAIVRNEVRVNKLFRTRKYEIRVLNPLCFCSWRIWSRTQILRNGLKPLQSFQLMQSRKNLLSFACHLAIC